MPYLSSQAMGFWNWINTHNGLITFVSTMVIGLARLSWKFKKWTDKVDTAYIAISEKLNDLHHMHNTITSRLDGIEHLIINVAKENNVRN